MLERERARDGWLSETKELFQLTPPTLHCCNFSSPINLVKKINLSKTLIRFVVNTVYRLSVHVYDEWTMSNSLSSIHTANSQLSNCVICIFIGCLAGMQMRKKWENWKKKSSAGYIRLNVSWEIEASRGGHYVSCRTKSCHFFSHFPRVILF